MADLRKFPGNRSPFDDLRHIEDDGTEWWSAREIMIELGYARWGDFTDTIDRAKHSCRNSGKQIEDNFRESPKVSGARGPAQMDVQLSRYGAYLVAMNGDPKKGPIAAAQRYFAVQTFRAETVLPTVSSLPSQLVQQLRPWGARLSETFKNHRLSVITSFGFGPFSTYTATVGEILIIEDELVHHQIPLKYGDLPDGSIGKRWSTHCKKEGIESIGKAPLAMPHLGMSVDVLVYDAVARPTFDEWLNTKYIPEFMPDYFANKKEWKQLYLPTASAADNASLRLTGNRARIPGPLRHEIDRAGGFISAASQPSKLSYQG